MSSIEVKVRKLDGELARYKEQMAKLRNGPGKVKRSPLSYHLLLASRAKFALSITLRLEPLSPPPGRDPATRPTHTKTKTDVRSPDRAADAADVQHGERRARHRQPAEHHGHRRRHADREQGDEETVRQDRH